MIYNRTPFEGGRSMRPTRQHRPAIWEGILATVYAMNDAGVVRYFDYDWDAAREFAGVAPDRDPRIARKTEAVSYTGTGDDREPRLGQYVLWIRKV